MIGDVPSGEHRSTRMDVYRLLHLAREHAAAVAFRPISFGNLSYLVDRIADLNVLGASLRRHAPPNGGHAQLREIANALEGINNRSSPTAFTDLVIACDRSGYRTELQSRYTLVPARAAPLLTSRYQRLIVVAGPAIGLGDEISTGEFFDDLAVHCGAALDVYTSYDAYWRTCFPQARVGSLTGRPMRALERIDSEVLTGRASSVLVVFVNFTGLDLYQLFPVNENRPDLLEVSVGKGTLCFAAAGTSVVEVATATESVLPNNYRSLRELQRRLTGVSRPPLWTRRRARAPHEGTRRILLNPLTSKDMILTPEDWAGLVSRALQYRAKKYPVHVHIHSGLTAESEAYAHHLASALEGRRSEPIGLESITVDSRRSPSTAVRSLGEQIGAADLVLGLDTFTAHLASFIGTPSAALCYHRNLAFWSDYPRTWWIEIKHGLDRIARCVAMMIDTLDAAIDLRTVVNELEPFYQSVLAHELHTDRASDEELYAAGQRAWDGCSAAHRELLGALDEGYSWPRLAALLKKGATAGLDRGWLRTALAHTHFYRYCGTVSHNLVAH